MASWMHNNIPDVALNYIITNASKVTLCSAQPATYAEAITTYKMAEVVIDSSDWTGPIDGDVSGRKISLAAQSALVFTATGICTHMAIVNTASSVLLYVVLIEAKSVLAGDECDTDPVDIELRDPT